MAEPIPDHTSVGVPTNRGLIRRPDGRLARVTRRAGAWGYWENGTRVEPFATREEAAADFMALREHRHTVACIVPDENGQKLTIEYGYSCTGSSEREPSS